MSQDDISSPAEVGERFVQELPAWLAGRLTSADAAWMADMQARYADLAEEAAWLQASRDSLRSCAAQENTAAAWQLLQRRLAADLVQDKGPPAVPTAVPQSKRRPPAWLEWLCWHPGWANGLAAMAMLLVLGQAGWWLHGSPAPQEGPAWRALQVDELQPESAALLQIWLRPGSPASALAEISQLLAQQPGLAAVSWRAEAAGSWSLMAAGPLSADQQQALLALLRAHPAVAQARWP